MILGPPAKNARRVRREVMRSRRLAGTIDQLAAQKGVPREVLARKADKILREIAANPQRWTFTVMRRLLAFVFGRIYDGIDVDEAGLERLRQAARRGPLVLLPSHKSHVDYLVLSYVFYDNGLPPPHVAAGANLSFFPLGSIFRRCARVLLAPELPRGRALRGGVRRVRPAAAAGRLPRRVLHRGGSEPHREGAQAEARPARDRRRRRPRRPGAHRPGGADRDHLREGARGGELRARARGRREEEGGPGGAPPGAARAPLQVRADRPAARRAVPAGGRARGGGRAAGGRAVRAAGRRPAPGAPGGLRDRPGDGDHPERPDRRRRLATTTRRAAAPGLDRRIGWLAGRARARGARFAVSLVDDFDGAIGRAVALLASDGDLELRGQPDDELVVVPPERRSRLEYYKNNAVHALGDGSIVARSLLAVAAGEGGADRGAVRDRALLCSRLLKNELIYRPGAGFDAIFAQTVDELAAAGWLRPAGARLEVTGEGRDALRVLAGVTGSYLAAYGLVVRTVAAAGSRPGRKDAVVKAAALGERALLLGELDRPEAISRPIFESALEFLGDAGALEDPAKLEGIERDLASVRLP